MKKGFNYQVIVVFDPKTEEKNKNEVLAKLEALVEAVEAKVAKTEKLGMRDLVYAIKGFTKGEFYEIEVESDKTLKLKEVNLYLNRETKVIRYLVLKK
jgi:ribosomal protein S6